MFVGHRARVGRGPGLGTDPEKAPGPPLDGVGLHSDSNGYGSDIEKGVCSERRRGAKKPHHGLQVYITTPSTGCVICNGGYLFNKLIYALIPVVKQWDAYRWKIMQNNGHIHRY